MAICTVDLRLCNQFFKAIHQFEVKTVALEIDAKFFLQIRTCIYTTPDRKLRPLCVQFPCKFEKQKHFRPYTFLRKNNLTCKRACLLHRFPDEFNSPCAIYEDPYLAYNQFVKKTRIFFQGKFNILFNCIRLITTCS